MLSHLGLIEELSLDPEKLRFFFAAVENGYNPCVYHNRTHAADVLQVFVFGERSPAQGGLHTRLTPDYLLGTRDAPHEANTRLWGGSTRG
jgi:hypothetical protein